MAVGKTKRTSKTSKGIHGGAHRLSPPLTEVAKVLMNKGMLVNAGRVQA